jgi:hypothetical protein
VQRVKLQVRGSALLVVVCIVAAGCGSGVSGPAVTAQNPDAASSGTLTVTVPARSTTDPNLIPNASFEDGIAPWQPLTNSRLELGKLTRRPKGFGHQALLVHPTKLVPFGASALIVGEPVPRTRYRFTTWLEGSPSTVTIQLQALVPGGDTWLNVGAVEKRVSLRWQRFSVTGPVPRRKTIEMRALVYARTSISRNSFFALDGVRAVRVGT